jgi:predicted short-subunit dehydrogenase-like oxidoreductase (DUF2520 family)
MKEQIQKIVILGTGNVATHLGQSFRRAGLDVIQVYGRRRSAAARLAGLLGASYTSDLSELNPESDLYLIAVSDDAIASVAEAFPLQDKLLAHTSGSIGLDALSPAGSHSAVFYPLQTFSTGRETDISRVPFCLETKLDADLQKLQGLAARLTTHVYHISSEHRRLLHLAAVFACNFTNHMYAVAEEMITAQGLPFDMLCPLITETAAKALAASPRAAQTGPAVRQNKGVMAKHLELLSGHPDYQKIYEIVSQSIINLQEKD